jgi:hypothetical protein
MDTGIFIGDKIITTSWDKIWDKPNTLSGYGITDAYTKSDADGKYVLKAGDTMTGGLNVNSIQISSNEINNRNNGYLYLGYRNTSSGVNLCYNNSPLTYGSNRYTILHTGNYAGELDNRYVNKAGDTMTGTLLMSNDSDIYGRSSANSGAAYIIGYRDAAIDGIVMHDISAANNTKALYIQTNGYDLPSDTGGLAITNDCVTAFGAGDNGSVFRVLNENNVNLGALFNVAKDGTLTRLGHKIFDNGNKRDMFSSMNEAFTTWGNEQVISVEGDANTYYPVVITINHSKTWNSRIAIHKNLGSRTPSYPGNHGNGTSSMWAMYEGRYSGWDGNSGYIVTKYVRQPYANLISKAELAGNSAGALVVYLRGGGCEYTVCTDYRGGINVYYERTEISGDSNYPVYVEPTASVGNQGVLNMVSYDYLVQKAVRLETPRTIFSKPFDGTNNVTGGAKFLNICIETDNNGNDSGRGSEINNYNSELNLQYNTSRDITMCFGGGNVRIGTGLSGYKLSVNGDTYCSGKITSANWIRSDLYSAGIDHYADDSYSAAYNACAPNNDNYCCYSLIRSGTYAFGIGFNTNNEIWLGSANSDRKAGAQWLQISSGQVTCSNNLLAKGGITMYSDLRKKNVLNSIIVPLDVMANADLFDYTFKTDEKCKVRAGTSAQYWNVFLPQVTDTDNEGFFTMSYDVLATTCVLSIAKHFQRFLMEDFNNHETRIEFLERENKELKDSNKEMMNRIIELERRAA